MCYQEFVKEFGEDKEKIIFDAFYHTPVVFTENIVEGIQKLGFSIDVDLPSAFIAGVLVQEPDIIYHEENHTFELKGIKRALISRGIESDVAKASVIHEYGRRLKFYFRRGYCKKNYSSKLSCGRSILSD